MSNKQDILNELKLISPLLLKLKEEEKVFSIPENYFKELADVVVFETKNETSILSSIKKEKIEVPENYFDTFGDAVLSTIKKEEKTIALPKQQSKTVSLFKRLAIAASIIGVVFLIKQVQTPTMQENNCADGIACLTQDEIYNYMDVNSHEFEVQDVQETVQPTLEKTETKINIDKKEATQYIETNNNILDADDASTDIF